MTSLLNVRMKQRMGWTSSLSYAGCILWGNETIKVIEEVLNRNIYITKKKNQTNILFRITVVINHL